MPERRMQAPSPMAGLVNYREEEESLIKLKPEYVVIITSTLIAVEVALVFLTKI